MRRLSAYFIVSLFIVQVFYSLGVTVYWLANHDYIARVLCENRDKPGKHCDGKCYLRKKLAAAQQDSTPAGQSAPKSSKKSIEISEFLLETGWAGLQPASFQQKLIPTIPGCCAIEPAARIFHPPALSLA